MKDEIKEILEEMYDIQVRYTKPLLKENYTDKDYAIENYENLVFKMKNIITNLQRERNNFKTALDESSEIVGELEDYKSRIDRAIEYIEKNVYEENNGCGYYYWEIPDKNDLLNILKGGIKNE